MIKSRSVQFSGPKMPVIFKVGLNLLCDKLQQQVAATH